MPGIDTTTGGLSWGTGSFYTAIMNEMALPIVADRVIYPNALLARLPRRRDRVQGKAVEYTAHTEDATGAVGMDPRGDLPEPDTESYARFSYFVRSLYVRMKIDGMTADASDTQIASWLDATMSEMEAKAKIMNRARQRMYHNDGSGRLAEISSASAGLGAVFNAATTYTLVINQGIVSPATCVTPPVRFLKPNMIVAVVSSAGVIRFVAKIATVTAPNQVTFTDPGLGAWGSNIAANDWVVTCSQIPTSVGAANIQNTGYKNEPMGLAGIVNDNNPPHDTYFQGVDASVSGGAWHRANVLTGGGVLRQLQFELLDLAWTTPIEIMDSVPTVWYSSFPALRKYATLFYGDRRYEGGYTTFDGGYKGLVYNNTPILPDRDMWNNRFVGVDETDLSLYVMTDLKWFQRDGAVFARLNDKDSVQAMMYCRETMGCDIRAKHVILSDINEA